MSRLTLRMPETLHRRLADQAEAEGVSLNQYLVYLLAQQSAPAYEVAPVPASEVRQRRQDFDAILSHLKHGTEQEARQALDQREES